MSESKVALVTGASRGIGRAIAEQLAKDGFTVVGTATSDKGAQSISDYLGDSGCGMKLNVTDHDEIKSVVAAITEKYGVPAVLINNAAITRDNLALRMKDDEWNDVINTNLNAVFHVIKACLKGMVKARFGRIVNISSIVGVTGNPGQNNYCAAKAGVIGYTKSLAQEIASRNVTVNAVAPGFIDTDMTKVLNDDQRSALLGQIPMNRLGEAQDVANAVSFLVSDSASYITGQTLHVNGGMFMA